MRKEPSTEAKFAFIFGLAMLSAMLCWIPVEPVSAGGPSPAYQQEAAYDTEVSSLTTAINLKAPKAAPTFTGQMSAVNATFSGNIAVTGTTGLTGQVTGANASFTGNFDIDGFSTFGGATGVKLKYLTGTMGASEGDITTIAHSLTGDKIISVTGIVRYAANSGLPPNWTSSAEYEWFLDYNATNINCRLSATNSGNLVSKSVVVMVWYIE